MLKKIIRIILQLLRIFDDIRAIIFYMFTITILNILKIPYTIIVIIFKSIIKLLHYVVFGVNTLIQHIIVQLWYYYWSFIKDLGLNVKPRPELLKKNARRMAFVFEVLLGLIILFLVSLWFR